MYNWQYPSWPQFVYNEEVISQQAMQLSVLFGKMSGMHQAFHPNQWQEQWLHFVTQEALTTSAIEGEMLSRDDIRSSLLKRLGLANIPLPRDKRALGVAQMMVAVREDVTVPLSQTLLQQWHATLIEGDRYVHGGVYRQSEETMQIVSGGVGHEVVHFEAPASQQVPYEMERLVAWHNEYKPTDWLLLTIKAAITHLWFESIHPFEDGNGRIGRALIERTLAQGIGESLMITISHIIERDKNAYYTAIKHAQTTLEINDWLVYFAQLLIDTLQYSLEVLHHAVRKMHFYDTFTTQLNERQIKALNKMWDAGPAGFEGGMTAKKYIFITGTSKATATRDLQQLVKLGVLTLLPAGRSSKYELNAL